MAGNREKEQRNEFRGTIYQSNYEFDNKAREGELVDGDVVGQVRCLLTGLVSLLIWQDGDVISRTLDHHINLRNREQEKNGDTTFAHSPKPPKKPKRDKKGIIPIGPERWVKRR